MIGAYSKTPLEKLTVQVRVALQMGLYQMLYMDSVPDSAAVNESVNLIKALGVSKASGFVNGVLRSVLRAEKKLPLPDEESDLPGHLSLRYSCPRWLVERWLKATAPPGAGGFWKLPWAARLSISGLIQSRRTCLPLFPVWKRRGAGAAGAGRGKRPCPCGDG